MKTHIKIPRQTYHQIMADLARPHAFAFERIGFCRAKLGNRGAEEQLVLITGYWPVADDQYIPDDYAGARINSDAIRAALQTSLTSGDGIFHVHLHDFPGTPQFSPMDQEEIPRIVESLAYANPESPHGMLVFSHDGAAANAVMPGSDLKQVDRISLVGQPTVVISKLAKLTDDERLDRQSFLGPEAPQRINSLRVAVIGLSGGGSHASQQLAHAGFVDFVFFDPQPVDLSNLNRLVGATEEDVAKARLKVDIAWRVVTGINSKARVQAVPARWQEHPEILRTCDIVAGCLDGFDERRQLEAACRRYLIPLVDVGMDVILLPGQPPRMAGQVILSLPGHPCFHCIGFLNERNLTAEAQRYGDAGGNPQVVWPNGSLTSTAVGIIVDLATGWTKSAPGLIYKSYDGNTYNMSDHPRYEYVWSRKCDHYRLDALGDF